jgi:hypothetical protein
MSKRNPGHNHPTPDGFEEIDQPVSQSEDSHPASHADHPYVASSHRFTKPAFHSRENERMKGQDVSTKGDHEFQCY